MKSLFCCLFPQRQSAPSSIQSSASSSTFELNLIPCIVCMDQVPEDSCRFCSDLDNSNPPTEKHSHCIDCVVQHARATITGTVGAHGTGLKCCDGTCSNVLIWGTIKDLLEENDAILLEKRLDAVALGSFNDIEYCLNCNFGAVLEENKERMPFFECQQCKAQFCRTCRASFEDHSGKTCKQLDKKRKRNTKKLQKQEKLTAATVRICPNCQTQFIKEEGCNKVTCSVCGTTMCYLCRTVGIDYDHFGGDECNLYANPDTVNRGVFSRILSRFRR